ncbi:tyrosine-type recombinase/integrase [Candidatus Contubernalis alkaliaceticus]|uniref:tyrosine-type recombinase/integrase n=1 Tax=Candidatus Contubernalis alkaliaceticus TaxID=338645 RepID=UPI001F4C3C19|nr:tyrosine-type recombinase/integrase [Candidatus Contubernalis alkalaceticus]UNC92420.1 tyrosine-type recombinase/integrase [Candidatus Contubernalis alkalaceticus]
MAGSIEKRGKNSWRLTVSCGIDSKGKQIKKTRTIKTNAKSDSASRKEAEKALDLFVAEVEAGITGTGRMSFKEFCEKWLKEYAEIELAPKTIHRYKDILETRIIPALGHHKVEHIKPMHLLEFYNTLRKEGTRLNGKYLAQPYLQELLIKDNIDLKELAEQSSIDRRTLTRVLNGKPVSHGTALAVSKTLGVEKDKLFAPKGENGGLSERTILHHHRLISSILTTAVQWQIVMTNPAARVKAPRVKKKEAGHFDEEATAKVLKTLEEEPFKYRGAVLLALASGCRRGEIMGLEWQDVNFEENTITIKQAAQYIPGQGSFTKSPKNESSERVISIPASVMALLKKYKVHQNEERMKLGDIWQGSERLFTTWNGQAMHPDTLSNWFPKFLKRHNLPHLNFHGLRHTAATLLIGQGLDIVALSSRLGHSDRSTTINIYTHALKRTDKEAADKMEVFFSKEAAT